MHEVLLPVGLSPGQLVSLDLRHDFLTGCTGLLCFHVDYVFFSDFCSLPFHVGWSSFTASSLYVFLVSRHAYLWRNFLIEVDAVSCLQA